IKPSIRPKTYASYEGTVRLHLLPALGRINLRNLSLVEIQNLLTTKTKAGLAPRSVRYILLVLRIALGQAERWDMLSRNMAKLVDGPRVPHRDVPVLTPEQSRTMLSAAQGDRFEAAYTLALGLGLRRGEVLGLRWEDLNLESGRLSVGGALQRIPGEGLLRVETKTTRSRRVITLPKVCISTLRVHRIRQIQNKLAAGLQWVETGYIFTTERGTPVDGEVVTRSLQRLLLRAGLPRLKFHDLRHGAASLLLAEGVAARVVMDVLGHSQISTTQNIYQHVMPSLVDDAAAAIDRALGGC
ncbi:MAG: tyrosine-type recombinase/integrase, partial [Candidatus Dormibacteraceae bacterium]